MSRLQTVAALRAAAHRARAPASSGPSPGARDVVKIALFAFNMGRGGVTTFALDLGAFLTTAGHSVSVVTCEQGGWWPRLVESGLSGICVPSRRWESATSYVRRLADHFVAERYDAVLVNIGVLARPAMLGIHRWPEAVAAVPVLHNDLPRVYSLAMLNRRAWNVAVAVSPAVQLRASALLPGKPVIHIPNGIRLPEEDDLRRRAGWSLPLRLLFVGRLSDATKGVLRLPEIVRECRLREVPVQLTVIGGGRDRSRLEEKAVACGVAEQIALVGECSAEEVHDAMKSHHALLFPSNIEGFPLVLVEAQANGCVPIASRLAGITDLAIKDGSTGYLAEASDAAAFAGHVARLADSTHWQALSAAGISRARRLFSLELMGTRYLGLIEALARGGYPLEVPRSKVARAGGPSLPLRDYLPNPVRRAAGRWVRRFRARP